jgi:acyl-CoA synthetase (NDP forming)
MEGIRRRMMSINSEAAMAVAFFLSAASVAWSAAFAYTRWLARPREQPLSSTESDHRLVALQQAIDTIAIEVERLSEAQRFTARLLEQRLPSVSRPPLPPSEQSNSITPH